MASPTRTATRTAPVAKTANRPAAPAGGPTESAQEKQIRISRERSEKFLKLAPKRMTNALKALQRLTQLGNRRSYTYTEEQVKAMHAALDAAMKKFDAAFGGSDAGAGDGFKFN